VLLLPFAVLKRFQKKEQDAALLNARHYLWADFLICVLAPVVVGTGLSLLLHGVPRPFLFLLCGGVALIGIIGALLDSLRRAHQYKAAIPPVVVGVVGTLWLSIAVLLALTSVFTMGMFAVFFFLGSFL
jgi:hypothetical protein